MNRFYLLLAPFAIANSLLANESLPVVDLSADTERHVIVAQGTEKVYQGHPTTVLLPDNKTIYCVWTLNHGGPCGPMKRSMDAGLRWEDVQTPAQWQTTQNCPTIYHLSDPQGKARLVVFAQKLKRNGANYSEMTRAVSADGGNAWSAMTGIGIDCVMPWCTIIPIEGGKKLLAATNRRRPGDPNSRSNQIIQSTSTDGGLTWSTPRIICDLPGLIPCEPCIIRSPDGNQLACLIRENSRKQNSLVMTSDDEGKTWSRAMQISANLTGDRHQAKYAPDGRLVVVFRDKSASSQTLNHFVGWVGSYESLVSGGDGDYQIKLLHSYNGGDCGYPGLELLPDGTFVATTYVKYRPGKELNSVVSVRFRLSETDRIAMAEAKFMQWSHCVTAMTATNSSTPPRSSPTAAAYPDTPHSPTPAY